MPTRFFTGLGESVLDALVVSKNIERWRIPGMSFSLMSVAEPGNPLSERACYRYHHGFIDPYGRSEPTANTTWRLGTLSTLFTATGAYWKEG